MALKDSMGALAKRMMPDREQILSMMAEMGINPGEMKAELEKTVTDALDEVRGEFAAFHERQERMEKNLIILIEMLGKYEPRISAIENYLVQDPKRPFLPPGALDGVDLHQPVEEAAE